MSILNFLTFERLSQWGLLPSGRKAVASFRNLEDKIYEFYLKRKNDKTTKRSKNIIDLIIEEDESLPEDNKWTKSEIVSNINLLQIVGADSTINATTTFVHYLAGQIKLQEEIREIVKLHQNNNGDIDLKNLQDSNVFNSAVKEITRMFGPAMTTTFRQITKTSNLGKYKVRKGDQIFVPCALKHNDPNLFEKPFNFDLMRFTENNLSKVNK